MADEATRTTMICAPMERCYRVVAAFEDYPSWARDVKEAQVLVRDEQGRGVDVAYRTAAFGRSTAYTLRYDYSVPGEIRWSLVEGDIMRRLDGSYLFADSKDDAGTDVTYHLSIDLKVPLPSFLKRRAEERIISTALEGLKAHVETSVR